MSKNLRARRPSVAESGPRFPVATRYPEGWSALLHATDWAPPPIGSVLAGQKRCSAFFPPLGRLAEFGVEFFRARARTVHTGVSVRLSERDEEHHLLDRLYGDCARGRGALVLVNGPVGSGKTALLQAFAQRTEEYGGLFLSVTASASERLHMFGLVDQLATAMRVSGVVADPLAADEVGVTVAAGEAEENPLVPLGLLQRIRRTVCELAERQPLVLGVDDVHFADEYSLQCLRYLIRRIDSSAVMIVMSESSCHQRELATLHAETLNLPHCHGIRLAPLGTAGVAEQLVEHLGGPIPPQEVVEPWAAVSGGNPLLLHALIEDRLMEDDPARCGGCGGPGAPAPGESFRNALLRCLHRCEPTMLEAARAVAVLGESASLSLLGDFLGGDTMAVRRSLADLNAAGLLASMRFRHERAQQAVLSDMAAADLVAMRGRVAVLLHECGAPASVVADQLMATHDAVRAVWRVDILREAARDAKHSGDLARAVEYLRHAAAICVDETQEAQVTAALAETQWLVDPGMATRHLHQLGRLIVAGRLTGDEAMVPVKQLLWRGDFAEADALLRIVEAGDGGEVAGPPRGAAASDAATARSWLSFCYPGRARFASPVHAGGAAEDRPTDHGTARPGTPDAWAAGGAAGHPFASSIGSGPLSSLAFVRLAVSLSSDGDGDEGRGADRVLRGTLTGSPLSARLFALVSLIHSYRLDEALTRSARMLEEPRIRRVPVRHALLETIRAAAALRQGDAATAGRSARTALEAVTPASWGVVVGLPLALAVVAATELGDHDAVVPYLNLPVPPIMFDTPFALLYLRAFGRHHLAMGRPDTALTNFRSCGELMVRWGLDRTELADWRNDAAAALLAMGDVGQARALAEEQLDLLGEGRSRARGIALRRLAAAGPVRDRPPLLHEAVRILEACGDQLELRRAEADLSAASAVLERLGTPGRETSYRNLHIEAKPVGASGSGPELTELTDAERRVGALAASGCTNREIAGRLFITVSTVEQHLTKIYRKLKVRSRSDLPVTLMEFSDTPCFPQGR
ncbi:AAA family ATPase [Streptomyces sp. NPDC001292]|uniref:ATP-binding protein n=1 Tax=Streptomyces sp. NPDC001292 TaxID=3364558 RepID=UPI003696966A